MKYREERIVQVLDYLASKLVGKRLSKLNALKLVYLADRDHLRKYGMPIIRDEYFAMNFGPVASNTKKMIERIEKDPTVTDYISVEKDPRPTMCGRDVMYVTSRRKPNMDQLSKTEVQSLNVALSQWPLHDDLVAFTHLFPEWKAAKRKLDAGAKRVKMSYLDFFKPCPEAEYCEADEELVALNRQVFEEECPFVIGRC